MRGCGGVLLCVDLFKEVLLSGGGGGFGDDGGNGVARGIDEVVVTSWW